MIIMQNIQQLKSAYEPYAFSQKNFLHDYETNNWLKMHGKPMRRKPFKRTKNMILGTVGGGMSFASIKTN